MADLVDSISQSVYLKDKNDLMYNVHRDLRPEHGGFRKSARKDIGLRAS